MDLLEDGGEELGLVHEVVVEGARGHARLGGEVVDGGGGEALDPNRAWPAASRAARVWRTCSSRNDGTPSCVAGRMSRCTHRTLRLAECRYAT